MFATTRKLPRKFHCNARQMLGVHHASGRRLVLQRRTGGLPQPSTPTPQEHALSRGEDARYTARHQRRQRRRQEGS
jgi:hypothetical protein